MQLKEGKGIVGIRICKDKPPGDYALREQWAKVRARPGALL